MTTTSIPGSSSGPATPASGASSAGGGIVRLNPFDGLFLRAEHLEQLQAYARELTHALGQAGGTGVVHGYGVTLSTAMRWTLRCDRSSCWRTVGPSPNDHRTAVIRRLWK